MTETDQKLEDAVLKRMLETPPTPHKEKKGGQTDGNTKKTSRPSK